MIYLRYRHLPQGIAALAAHEGRDLALYVERDLDPGAQRAAAREALRESKKNRFFSAAALAAFLQVRHHPVITSAAVSVAAASLGLGLALGGPSGPRSGPPRATPPARSQSPPGTTHPPVVPGGPGPASASWTTPPSPAASAAPTRRGAASPTATGWSAPAGSAVPSASLPLQAPLGPPAPSVSLSGSPSCSVRVEISGLVGLCATGKDMSVEPSPSKVEVRR